jgi:ferredoxin--NADP+ reductase
MSAQRFCSAELIERHNVSDTLAVFRFHPAEPLTFKAGQYATLAVEADGDLLERPYSIASSPLEPFVEFFIELVSGGLLTPKLWELELGSAIQIRRRIVGQFTLDPDVRRHLMMATVTGVAPFVSIARTLRIDRERGAASDDRLLLVHGASRSADFGPYLDELKKLATEGWLNYIPTISRPWEDPAWPGEVGRVEDVLRKYADQAGLDHSNSTAYACGHPQMVENVKSILLRARFVSEQVRQEEYFTLLGPHMQTH